MKALFFMLFFCVSCELPDPGVRAYSFDYEYKKVSDVYLYSNQYRIIIAGSLNGVEYYNIDTILIKSDEVYIKTIKNK